ncbi:MAG: tRNA dihydrouridine synthase DusB [Candidatus Caenarcaniphilales bacterium]|nr:tRNA dihydrouridine synthase DusB [Candidatus Caenarcaniphilales bacterium]
MYIPPMAGVTDLVYRTLCRELDPDVLLATEMLSSKSLTFAHKNKFNHDHAKRMQIPEGDALTGIQLFGHEPDVMAEAARIAEEVGAKFIDINMGCPVPKIVKGMDGAALMREPELAAQIVSKVIQATSLPVTVKMRLGWCSESINSPDLAKSFEQLGVQALTIHGRTRAQKYTGEADWQLIRNVVESISIPVFANGDVKDIFDAKEIIEISGASGVAIARATMGKPWLSKQVNHYIKTGEILPEPSILSKIQLAIRHTEMLVEHKGLKTGIQEARRHIANYTHGIPGAGKLRAKIMEINSLEEAKETISKLANLSLT